MSELLDTALYYNSLGYYVFPIKPGGVTPAFKGYKDNPDLACVNPDLIKKLWNKRDYNIGLILPLGYTVVDLDRKHGKNGVHYLYSQVGYNLKSWSGPFAVTPTGGVHMFTKCPDLASKTLGSRTNVMGVDSGVDLKGNGVGYVLIAPSKTKKGIYRWGRKLGALREVVSIPDKLSEKIKNWAETDGKSGSELTTVLDFDKLPKLLRDSFAVVLDAIKNANPGERNTILHKKAFYLAMRCLANGINPVIIVGYILEANKDSIKPESVQAVKNSLNSTINNATAKFYENLGHKLDRNQQGKATAIDSNVNLILTEHKDFIGLFGYDERGLQPCIMRDSWLDENKTDIVEYPRPLLEYDFNAICDRITNVHGISTSINQVTKVLGNIFDSDIHCIRFDPFADILKTLEPWDKKERLYTWLIRATGCENNAMNRMIGRKLLISIVARTFNPGCKVDTVLCLLGKQGYYKSTLCELLAFDKRFYLPKLGDLNNKDTLQAIQGAAIVEVAEIAAFKKADTETIKGFISTAIDKFRPPYGHLTKTYLRKCIFVATSNYDDILKDSTGSRRFWPVAISDNKPIDIKWIKANRSQLFSEAVEAYKAGEKWWFDKENEVLLQERNFEFTETDVYENAIMSYLELSFDKLKSRYLGCNISSIGGLDGFLSFDENMLQDRFDDNGNRVYCTIDEIINKVLEIKTANIRRSDEIRIGTILVKNKWVRKRVMENGFRKYRYFKAKQEEKSNVINFMNIIENDK